MLRSLPFVLIALLTVAGCGDAPPPAPAPPEGARTTDTAPKESVPITDAPAEAAEAPDAPTGAPAAAPAPGAAAPAQTVAPAPTATRVPMVEVNTDASVHHATSGAEELTLRSGPSTSSETLGTFNYAFVVECQDLKYDDAWCRIRAEMLDREPVGWAKRRHLIYAGNSWAEENGVRLFGNADFSGTGDGRGAADGFPVAARWDILADDGYANVRATPGADGAIVRRLDNRIMTDVVRCDGGAPGRRWCEISSPVSGWVHQSGFHRDLRSL